MSCGDIRSSQSYTFGNHLYKRAGETVKVVFENVRLGIQRTIVNNSGKICGFPGLAYPEVVSRYSTGYLSKCVRFRSEFTLLDNSYAMIWQIQPDGRYWEDDDGFGGTSDDEIDLYARLDDTGKFIEPFRLYSIGSSKLYGTDVEEEIARTLNMEEDPLSSLRGRVPAMLEQIGRYIEREEKGTAFYNIPGTVYQARLSLRKEGSKWFVRVEMAKRLSDSTLIDYLRFAPLEEQQKYLKTEQAKEDAERKLVDLLDSIKQKE